MRINVGCGTTPTKGWRNFDNSLSLRLANIPFLPSLLFKTGVLEESQYQFIQFARSHQVEYGDATKELPISSGSVDVLYSSHMLEHLDRAEAISFLKEARRLLRPGGIIRIAVPDIRKLVDHYIGGGNADEFIEATLLCQPRPKTIVQRLKILLVGTRHHQWMYDGASLRSLLLEHGFINSTIVQPGETNIANPDLLDLKERSSESVYVEAENP